MLSGFPLSGNGSSWSGISLQRALHAQGGGFSALGWGGVPRHRSRLSSAGGTAIGFTKVILPPTLVHNRLWTLSPHFAISHIRKTTKFSPSPENAVPGGDAKARHGGAGTQQEFFKGDGEAAAKGI